MYKTLGGYNWSDLFMTPAQNSTVTVNPLQQHLNEPDIQLAAPGTLTADEQFETFDKTILQSAKELQSSFHGLKAVSFSHLLLWF